MSAAVAPRAWQRAATSIAVAVGLLTVATVWMTVANGGVAGMGLGEHVALLLAFYAYLAVGLVLIARRPGNALGWVLAGIGLLTALGSAAGEYARLGLPAGGPRLPAAWVAAWFDQWWWYPTISLVLVFVPLLFPTGRPPTPRWRWVVWLATGTVVVTAVLASLTPVLRTDTYTLVNPLGIAGMGDVEDGVLGIVTLVPLVVCMLAGVASLIVRFRRSRGVERQQMKWFVYAGVLTVAMPVAQEVGLGRFLPDSNMGFAVVLALLPVAMGVAVTRYRLYEIDRLISRTLTYALLSAMLVALYLGAVTMLTALTAPVTGDSPLAVAAATLLVAAAFSPARRRIQWFVDRRFNRARYDAARTVQEYRAQLRDELDLAAIAERMRTAADAAVQPAGSIVWLRTDGSR